MVLLHLLQHPPSDPWERLKIPFSCWLEIERLGVTEPSALQIHPGYYPYSKFTCLLQKRDWELGGHINGSWDFSHHNPGGVVPTTAIKLMTSKEKHGAG